MATMALRARCSGVILVIADLSVCECCRNLEQQHLHQLRQRDLLCGLQHDARLVLDEQAQLRSFELVCHSRLPPSVSRTEESLRAHRSRRAASAGFQEKTAARPTACSALRARASSIPGCRQPTRQAAE